MQSVHVGEHGVLLFLSVSAMSAALFVLRLLWAAATATLVAFLLVLTVFTVTVPVSIPFPVSVLSVSGVRA